jgi:hypothetical protein
VQPVASEVPPTPKKARRVGWIITVILLALALVSTGAVLAFSLIRLDEARGQIEDQRELIEKKQTFGSAAQDLMQVAAQLDGSPYASLVDTAYYTSIIGQGWQHRWNGVALDRDTETVRTAADDLAAVLTAAQDEAAINATGTVFETLTDQLGAGYVKTSLDTVGVSCDLVAWGCVTGDDPFTIHYAASEIAAEPYMSDWLRTGVAYHEYAHVLQMTNPGPTATAVESFGGDWETMADCYALTYLPGWTLDHTIWTTEYQYWEISVGYGYTCDEAQAQVVRDWVDAIGYTHAPISQ